MSALMMELAKISLLVAATVYVVVFPISAVLSLDFPVDHSLELSSVNAFRMMVFVLNPSLAPWTRNVSLGQFVNKGSVVPVVWEMMFVRMGPFVSSSGALKLAQRVHLAQRDKSVRQMDTAEYQADVFSQLIVSSQKRSVISTRICAHRVVRLIMIVSHPARSALQVHVRTKGAPRIIFVPSVKYVPWRAVFVSKPKVRIASQGVTRKVQSLAVVNRIAA